MTSNQNSLFNMYQAVAKVSDDFAALVASVPAFKADMDTLTAIIPQIRRIDAALGVNRSDDTVLKNQTKDDMCALAFNAANNIKAHGIKTKDESLKSLGTTSVSALKAGTEEDCLQRCQRIAEKARLLLAPLQERGYRLIELESLEAQIAQFTALKPQPQVNKKEKSALVVELNDKFNEADDALETIRLILGNFEKSNPDFHKRFENVLLRIDPYTKTTKIKFVPENAITGELLKNFEVTNTSNGFRASVNGAANPTFDSTHHNDTNFVFTKEGFKDAVVEHVKVIRGKVNRITVKMKPII